MSDILDRELRDLFANDPQTASTALVDEAISRAASLTQRRPRFARLDRQAWPPQGGSIADPAVGRALRLVVVAVFIALSIAAVAAIGALVQTREPSRLVPAGELHTLILGPRALALPDRRVLVYGQGHEAIFDPATGESVSVDLGPFVGPDVHVLPDGRIIVIGPKDDTGGPHRIGIFDPAGSGTTIIGELPSHFGAATAVLDDGRVLFAGGADTDGGFVAFDSVHVFDPTSGVLSELGPMLKPRVGQAMVALDHGRVLIVGVDSTGNHNSTVDVEVYDVARGSSEAVGTLARSEFFLPGPSVRLSDGRVLISGSQVIDRQCGEPGDGHGGPYFETHEEMHLFDPATGRLTQLPDIPHASAYVVPTSDGRVVLFGSYLAFPNGCQRAVQPLVQPWVGVYDPTTGVTIETTNPMTGTATLPFDVVHYYGAGVLLPDGRVALITDDEGAAQNAVDLFTVGR